MVYPWETAISFGSLQTLLEVADLGSIAAAAKKTGKSISSISRHLHQLEESFGCKLRENSGKTIGLSAEGHSLAVVIRKQRLELMSFSEKAKGDLKSVRIAAGDSLLHLIVLPRLSAIQKAFKHCNVRIVDLRTFDIMQGLQNFSIDLGFLREDSVKSRRERKNGENISSEDELLDYRVLGEYKYSVFVSKRLLNIFNIATIQESDLSLLPFAMIKNHWGKNFVEMARQRGQTAMNIRVWCETFTQVARLVRLHDYAGILPQFAREIMPDEQFVSFEPPFLRSEKHNIVMVWNQNLLRIRQMTLGPFFDFIEKEFAFTRKR